MPALFSLIFLLSASLAQAAQTRGQQDYFCKDIELPFFSQVGSTIVPLRPHSEVRAFSAVKPAGVSRVFVVGESVAARLGSGEPQERRSHGLEIINCGMGGYDSYRIAGVFDEILKYKPDMVVLLSGNNEGGGESCGGFFGELRRRERRLLERLYSVSGSGAAEASLRIHRRRLKAMAAAARRKGIPLVICALPYNYLMPPYGTAPEDDVSYYRGRRALEGGDAFLAFSEFSRLALRARAGPFPAYYAGLSLLNSGRAAESLRYLELAPSVSSQDKTSSKRNALIKRVAREEGACLADLDAVFRKISPGGVPGFGQFVDGMHWEPGYDDLVWDTIFSAARACGIKAAASYTPAAAGAAPKVKWGFPEERLSYAVSWIHGEELDERAVAELMDLLRHSPLTVEKAAGSPEGLKGLFINNFWSSGTAAVLDELYPAFLFHTAEAYRRSGNQRTALKLAKKLEAKGYSGWRVGLLKAKALHALGRSAEAQASLSSLSGAGESAAAAFALGTALGLSVEAPCVNTPREKIARSRGLSDSGNALIARGDLGKAAISFEDAYAADPHNIGALLNLCALKKKLSIPDAALDCYGKAAASALRDCGAAGRQSRVWAAAAFLEAGRIQLELGNPSEAAAALDKALKAAPADWDGAAAARELLVSVGHKRKPGR